MNNEFNLSNEATACLLLLNSGMNEIPDIFTAEVKEELLKHKLIELSQVKGWFITELGKTCADKKILVKYPLSKRSISSYDKTVSSMSASAINALIASMVNNKAFEKIDKKTLRVMMQHLLNIELHKMFGEELINKWFTKLSESKQYFDAKNRNKKR